MNLLTLVQIVGGVIITIATLSAVIAYFKTNISKNTIELYRQDNDALRLRISSLESELRRNSAEVIALRASVVTLQNTVTQKESVDRILRLAIRFATKEGIPVD